MPSALTAIDTGGRALTANQAEVDSRALVERLYKAHASRLGAFARMLTGSVASGDDLVQDVFIDLLRTCDRRPGYVHEPAWPLLRVMAVRLAAQRRRSVVRELRRLVRFSERPSEATWEGDRDVIGALLTLPPRMRACVVLRYLEDLSTAQVATAMDTQPGTVAAQLVVARKRLRRKLESADGVPASLGARGTRHGA